MHHKLILANMAKVQVKSVEPGWEHLSVSVPPEKDVMKLRQCSSYYILWSKKDKLLEGVSSARSSPVAANTVSPHLSQASPLGMRHDEERIFEDTQDLGIDTDMHIDRTEQVHPPKVPEKRTKPLRDPLPAKKGLSPNTFQKAVKEVVGLKILSLPPPVSSKDPGQEKRPTRWHQH